MFIKNLSRPTPQLSFTVRELHAFAGVVITASHNPKQYNGFKVYGEDGAQLVPAEVNAIVEHMNAIEDLFEIRVADLASLEEQGVCQWILEELDASYLTNLLTLKDDVTADLSMKLVYTPLYGVGFVPVMNGLKQFGFNNLHFVEQQAIQDGAFPTVSYPNPEEPAAFELAMELGNQLGALLLHYLLQTKQVNGLLPTNGVMIKTIVTAELGTKIAAHFNVDTINTFNRLQIHRREN